MWSQGRFRADGADADDMLAFAQATARLGFPAIEINYVIPPQGVDALLTNDHVAIASLHSPTPRIKMPNGKSSEALNLASPNEDERVLAVERALITIDHAARCGARYIVVHLGGIEGGIFEEERELLDEYPPHVAGFWLDVGHAEVLGRLGLEPHGRWLNELSDRCIGTHVHDVDGLADHRAPGHGTADWPHYAAKLPPDAPRIFEINQKMPEDQVAAAIPFLRERGVLPPA